MGLVATVGFRGNHSKRGGDRGAKGLRHFSRQVCDKVQQRGTTSYNEVRLLIYSPGESVGVEGRGREGRLLVDRRVLMAMLLLLLLVVLVQVADDLVQDFIAASEADAVRPTFGAPGQAVPQETL